MIKARNHLILVIDQRVLEHISVITPGEFVLDIYRISYNWEFDCVHSLTGLQVLGLL